MAPAGSQTTLGSLPTASALSPDGRKLLVLNTGDDRDSVQVVDTATGQVTQTIGYAAPEGLYAGVAFSPDGTHAYASAGGGEKIRVYSVTRGLLTEGQPIQLPVTNPAGARVNMYPAGLAVTPDGNRLRRLAGKLIGQLHHCLTHRVPYNETAARNQPEKHPKPSPPAAA